MDAFEYSCSLVPIWIRQSLKKYIHTEEIRLRCGYPPAVVIDWVEVAISSLPVQEEDLLYVLEVATGASVHSVSFSMEDAFICTKGVRIGVCGQAVYKDGKIQGFRKYCSLAIRIPHQCQGIIPEEIVTVLSAGKENTLIVASPGLGKTTALRELIRCTSQNGLRICVVDERGELYSDAFDLGKSSDVLCGVPKAEGALMMLRALNPQLIAMDEISSPEDIAAILQIAGCGVNIFATAHGHDLQDMQLRPVYRKLLHEGIFENILSISLKKGKREYKLERIHT